MFAICKPVSWENLFRLLVAFSVARELLIIGDRSKFRLDFGNNLSKKSFLVISFFLKTWSLLSNFDPSFWTVELQQGSVISVTQGGFTWVTCSVCLHFKDYEYE